MGSGFYNTWVFDFSNMFYVTYRLSATNTTDSSTAQDIIKLFTYSNSTDLHTYINDLITTYKNSNWYIQLKTSGTSPFTSINGYVSFEVL